MPIMAYIGVVFPFVGVLSSDHYNFYFLVSWKEILTLGWLLYSTVQTDRDRRRVRVRSRRRVRVRSRWIPDGVFALGVIELLILFHHAVVHTESQITQLLRRYHDWPAVNKQQSLIGQTCTTAIGSLGNM